MKPRLFISAVSSELRTTRQLVANVLLRLGYDPVWQDIFGTEPGDLRQMLRNKIDDCDGLIHLVGYGYGAEPHELDPGSARVSYTQFEFLYAHWRGKKTWVLFAEEGCTYDTPLEQLDVPLDAAHPDPVGYYAERRALQDAWRQRLKSAGHLRRGATSDSELELNVERLRDEFAELRRAFRSWQRNLTRNLAVVAMALIAMGAGVWWTVFRQPSEVRETVEATVREQTPALARTIAEQLAALKPEDIKAQMRRTIEETYRKQLQEAERLTEWEKRDDAKELAEESRARRFGQLDEFMNSITSTIQSGETSTEFLELTRIIQEEGVDQAAAYITSNDARLLSEAEELTNQLTKQLTKQRRQKLAPLLEGVRLYRTKDELNQALELCDKLLKQDGDWPWLLHEHCLTRIELGDRATRYETSASALAHFEAAENSARRLVDLDASQPAWQIQMSLCSNRLGDVFLKLGRTDEALAQFEKGLEISLALAEIDPGDAQNQRGLVGSYRKLGTVFLQLGRTEDAVSRFEECLRISRELVEADPSDAQNQLSLAVSYTGLGEALLKLGRTDDALTQIEADQKIARALAEADPRNAEKQRFLSVSYNNLGAIFLRLGRMDDALTQIEASVKIARALAEADPRDVQRQRDLASSYNRLGEVLLKLGRTEDALTKFENGLRISHMLAEADPVDARKQRDLMFSYHNLGEEQFQLGQYESAIERFQQGIEVLDALIEKRRLVELAEKEKGVLEKKIQICQMAEIVTLDWEIVLRVDAKLLPELLYQRAQLLAPRGRVADVAQAGAKLRELEPKTGGNLYNAARVYSLCAALVVRDNSEPSAAEQAEHKAFIDLSLACLKEAIAAGWDDFEHMRQDNGLASLDGVAEFEGLFPDKGTE